MKKWKNAATLAGLMVVTLPALAGSVAGTEIGNNFNGMSTVNVTGANGGNAGGVDKNREELSVAVLDSGKPVAGAKCTLTNAKGDWSLTAPDTVKVKRSDTNLQVKCEAPGYDTLVQTIQASTTQIPRPQFRFSTDSGGDGGDGDAMITVPNYRSQIMVTLVKPAPQAAN